ncbi:MAG: insulinase family protein [Dysgonamonadaceae bacterium]|jgi:predicted Zn-dependent peptidase|nr:insulinase family protein [Dysgonamonadaceae bacterium]
MKTIYSLFAFLFVALTLNAQTLDRSIRPESAPAKEIQIKDAQVFTLKNGLRVFLVEDKSTPITYYSLQLDVKPALEGDKAGVSDIFSDVYGKATVSRNKEQLNKETDLIAAQLHAHPNGVYISFLKKYEKQAIELFSDVLLNPVFAQEDFDLAMEKMRTALSSLGDEAGQMNDRVAAALTYGKKFPDGELTTKQTIENVKIADLKTYYNTYFAPNVARLVIVGDISLKEAKDSAEKYLGKWKKKNVPVAKYTIPSAPETTEVAYVVKPEAVQSVVTVTYPVTFRIGQPNYEAANVMNTILGGPSTGYLFVNLREKHSYTYGTGSRLSAGELIGRFRITNGGYSGTSVKAAITDSAVYQILHEMNRIINEPVTEKSLKAAKTFLAGNFSRNLEESGTLAEFAVNIDKYNLPKDYYRNFLKRLDVVSVNDVQAAAQEYIKPKNAWIVVAGDAAHAESLLPFAGNNTIQYFDYNANPVEKPVAESADVSAEEIIANYINALGGKDAIEKIKDYTIIADMSAMGQMLTLTQSFKAPNKSLVLMEMNGMLLQRMAFDGSIMRISGMGGSQEISEGDMVENMKNSLGVAPEMNFIENGYTLSVGDMGEVNGEKAYVLTAVRGESKTVIYFDATTGLKVRSVEMADTPMGEMQTVTEYMDYRDVEGVKFPFLMKQNAGGMASDITVKSIEVNKGLEVSMFQ